MLCPLLLPLGSSSPDCRGAIPLHPPPSPSASCFSSSTTPDPSCCLFRTVAFLVWSVNFWIDTVLLAGSSVDNRLALIDMHIFALPWILSLLCPFDPHRYTDIPLPTIFRYIALPTPYPSPTSSPPFQTWIMIIHVVSRTTPCVIIGLSLLAAPPFR